MEHSIFDNNHWKKYYKIYDTHLYPKVKRYVVYTSLRINRSQHAFRFLGTFKQISWVIYLAYTWHSMGRFWIPTYLNFMIKLYDPMVLEGWNSGNTRWTPWSGFVIMGVTMLVSRLPPLLIHHALSRDLAMYLNHGFPCRLLKGNSLSTKLVIWKSTYPDFHLYQEEPPPPPRPGGGGGGVRFHVDGDGDVPLDRVWFCGHQYWHRVSKSA